MKKTLCEKCMPLGILECSHGQPATLKDLFLALAPHFSANGEIPQALERDRVIGVLDAWSDANPDLEAFVTFRRDTHDLATLYVCCSGYNSGKEISFFGPTHSAARAAAAKAIEVGEV